MQTFFPAFLYFGVLSVPPLVTFTAFTDPLMLFVLGVFSTQKREKNYCFDICYFFNISSKMWWTKYLRIFLSLNYLIPEAKRSLLSYILSIKPDLFISQSLKILSNFYLLFYMLCFRRVRPNKAILLASYSTGFAIFSYILNPFGFKHIDCPCR